MLEAMLRDLRHTLSSLIRAESGDSTRDVALVPLLEEMVGPVRPALLAMLAAVGIYGVGAHAVAARSREIGIRVALGAPSTGVVGSMVGRAALLGLVGIALGAVASLLATRILGGLLYGVEASDPLTLAAAGILLLAATLVASYLPARRALRIDPLVALRGE